MKILVLNGPNINMLGIREPQIYGSETYEALISNIESYCSKKNAQVECKQTNSEGELVDFIQKAFFDSVEGIVINPGAYTHTSIALLDAIRSIPVPVVEVHISNVHAREDFRHTSMIAPACKGVIAGFGLQSYDLAIRALLGEK